jgi:hypothetical protein
MKLLLRRLGRWEATDSVARMARVYWFYFVVDATMLVKTHELSYTYRSDERRPLD